MKGLGLKIIDWYIIRKFLGTFFFALVLIICISVVFDVSEKIDDFIEKNAPLKAIIFDYYLNFIPYFAVLFSPLFTFITVIFFTSKMAYNTEIIAILSSGTSFKRLLVPYFIGATVLCVFAFGLNNYVIPKANEKRLEFEELYYREVPTFHRQRDIHKQIKPGIFIYMESYSNASKIGYKFSMEKFDASGQLVSKLMSDYVRWDTTTGKWSAKNYYIRTIDGLHEKIETGRSIDTTLNITPTDLSYNEEKITETMSIGELRAFIKQQKLQGTENLDMFLIDLYNRFAFPFSTFILTLIGVSVSSKKIKGGMGMQIGFGLLLTFSYLLFMQFSQQFAIGGAINPLLATWIPNIIYAVIATILYYIAPK
jgi:lipopolysaccharide export system permease protein